MDQHTSYLGQMRRVGGKKFIACSQSTRYPVSEYKEKSVHNIDISKTNPKFTHNLFVSCVNVLCNVLLLSPNKQLPPPTLYQVQQVAVALFMSGRNTEDSVVQRAAFTSRSQKLADPLNASVPASLHAQINPRPRSTSVAAQAPSIAAQNNPQPPHPYRAHHHISTQSIQKKLQKKINTQLSY